MNSNCIDLTNKTTENEDAEFEKMLIEAVTEQTCLYAKDHRQYNNRLYRHIIWLRIAKNFNLSTLICINKWYSLVQKFLRIVRLEGCGIVNPEDKNWQPYAALKKIQPVMVKNYMDLVSLRLFPKYTMTQQRELLNQLEINRSELMNPLVTSDRRQQIWIDMAEKLNESKSGTPLAVIAWQMIWWHLKQEVREHFRERDKCKNPQEIDQVFKICQISSSSDAREIEGKLASSIEIDSDNDILQCIRQLSPPRDRNNSPVVTERSGICDVCMIDNSNHAVDSASWSSAAKHMVPMHCREKVKFRICTACYKNLKEKVSFAWKVCRMCANETQELENILSTTYNAARSIFFKATGFSFYTCDGLPCFICVKCRDHLLEFNNFYDRFTTAQEKLRNIQATQLFEDQPTAQRSARSSKRIRVSYATDSPKRKRIQAPKEEVLETRASSAFLETAVNYYDNDNENASQSGSDLSANQEATEAIPAAVEMYSGATFVRETPVGFCNGRPIHLVQTKTLNYSESPRANELNVEEETKPFVEKKSTEETDSVSNTQQNTSPTVKEPRYPPRKLNVETSKAEENNEPTTSFKSTAKTPVPSTKTPQPGPIKPFITNSSKPFHPLPNNPQKSFQRSRTTSIQATVVRKVPIPNRKVSAASIIARTCSSTLQTTASNATSAEVQRPPVPKQSTKTAPTASTAPSVDMHRPPVPKQPTSTAPTASTATSTDMLRPPAPKLPTNTATTPSTAPSAEMQRAPIPKQPRNTAPTASTATSTDTHKPLAPTQPTDTVPNSSTAPSASKQLTNTSMSRVPENKAPPSNEPAKAIPPPEFKRIETPHPYKLFKSETQSKYALKTAVCSAREAVDAKNTLNKKPPPKLIIANVGKLKRATSPDAKIQSDRRPPNSVRSDVVPQKKMSPGTTASFHRRNSNFSLPPHTITLQNSAEKPYSNANDKAVLEKQPTFTVDCSSALPPSEGVENLQVPKLADAVITKQPTVETQPNQTPGAVEATNQTDGQLHFPPELVITRLDASQCTSESRPIISVCLKRKVNPNDVAIASKKSSFEQFSRSTAQQSSGVYDTCVPLGESNFSLISTDSSDKSSASQLSLPLKPPKKVGQKKSTPGANLRVYGRALSVTAPPNACLNSAPELGATESKTDSQPTATVVSTGTVIQLSKPYKPNLIKPAPESTSEPMLIMPSNVHTLLRNAARPSTAPAAADAKPKPKGVVAALNTRGLEPQTSAPPPNTPLRSNTCADLIFPNDICTPPRQTNATYLQSSDIIVIRDDTPSPPPPIDHEQRINNLNPLKYYPNSIGIPDNLLTTDFALNGLLLDDPLPPPPPSTQRLASAEVEYVSHVPSSDIINEAIKKSFNGSEASSQDAANRTKGQPATSELARAYKGRKSSATIEVDKKTVNNVKCNQKSDPKLPTRTSKGIKSKINSL